MNDLFLLENETARQLYEGAKDLPIFDYHCHLSPKEIFEDLPFENIGELWLGGDHYKWRLMRTCGIDERLITGEATWKEKFFAFAEALSLAAGNPLYAWSHMELSRYFGIDTPLRPDTAEDIWNEANESIRENRLSPRKLMEMSRVEVVCTTDDPTDDLEYHRRLREEGKLRVLPSFRTDALLQITKPGYSEYLRRLETSSGIKIDSLPAFCDAILRRLDYFCTLGCRCTDVGIPVFPDRIAEKTETEETFRRALTGEPISDPAYRGFLGYLYRFLGAIYRERGLMMQWHLAVQRNVNGKMFRSVGADCGCDCVADAVPGAHVAAMLDAIDRDGGLPQTVVYTLNGAAMPMLASVAGSFRNVRCGTAWWFCDHRRGIEDAMQTVAENSCFGKFLGMLTDSRSFLSYARHDYFRRILCTLVGSWIERGEYDAQSAPLLIRNLCCDNIAALLK